MGKYTIIIEATDACDPQRRGIGMQMRAWLEAAPYADFPNIQFIIATEEVDATDLPSINAPNVEIVAKKASGTAAYIDHLYWLGADLILLPRATTTYFRKSPTKSVAIDYGMEDLYCRHYIAPRPLEDFLAEHEFALQNFTSIITVSETSKHDLAWFFPEHKDKISVVHPSATAQNATTEDVTLPESLQDTSYFFTIGYEKKKNIRRIADAFDAFKQNTGSATKLVIAGKPGYGAAELDEHIETLGSATDIIRLGYVAEAQKQLLMQNCHALIALPIYEGFGISALEGLVADKIVLASDNGSLKEIVGKAGFLVDPFSTDVIEKQLAHIDTLAANPKQEHIADRLKVFDAATQGSALLQHLETTAGQSH